MDIQYRKATWEDFPQLIDFANYVFSHSGDATDFPTLLPKLYRTPERSASCHWIALENGLIKGVVGCFPLKMQVGDELLSAYGIGTVSVHPYARSRGYMRRLMSLAIEEMQANCADFSCLGGRRQRYEHFGYTPCGVSLVFRCSAGNLKQFQPEPGLSLRLLTAQDSRELTWIYTLYNRRPARVLRQEELLFDILSSWNARTFLAEQNGEPVGYLLASQDGGEITELELTDYSLLPQLLLRYFSQIHSGNTRIYTLPFETEKTDILRQFAHRYELSDIYSFHIFNYPKVLSAFLGLKGQTQRLPDGETVIRVLEHGTFRIAVQNGVPKVTETEQPPQYELTHLEAMQLFFAPVSLFSFHKIFAQEPFLRSLFPLPLFYTRADEI